MLRFIKLCGQTPINIIRHSLETVELTWWDGKRAWTASLPSSLWHKPHDMHQSSRRNRERRKQTGICNAPETWFRSQNAWKSNFTIGDIGIFCFGLSILNLEKKDLTSRLFNLATTGQTCAHMRSCCWTFFRGTIKANYVKTPQTGFTANRVHFGTLLSEYAFDLFEMTVIYPTEIINTPP